MGIIPRKIIHVQVQRIRISCALLESRVQLSYTNARIISTLA